MVDQVAIAAVRLLLMRFDLVEDDLDAVDRGENERDGLGGDRHAVAELAHQRFGGVRQRFEPGQSEKAAGALDGMDEAKDVAEDFAVVRLLLEAHELGVDPVETLAGLGQELAQQVVHTNALVATRALRVGTRHNVYYCCKTRADARSAARHGAPDRTSPLCCQRV